MKKSFLRPCIVTFLLFLFTASYAQLSPGHEPPKTIVMPDHFARQLVMSGFYAANVLDIAEDGRIFIGEQHGVVRVIKDGVLLPEPFVEIDVDVNFSGERGLLGIELDPKFSENQFVYVFYTVVDTPSFNRITRFTANGDVALIGSDTTIIDLDPLNATIHNGGAMKFGVDDKLYVAVGENSVPSNSQDLNTYHGKLLRINRDGSVPQGNPFPEGSEQKKRVWSFGLRNPFSMDIDPETGRILVNDVGQGGWEEVNDATEPGKNFGWPLAEGNSTNPEFSNPVYSYPHGTGEGKGCAITGGAFFRPKTTNYPGDYYGRYFFMDFCNGWIDQLSFSNGQIDRLPFISGFTTDNLSITVSPDGNLYYIDRHTQRLYKIIYNATTAPFIINHPTDVIVSEGESSTFEVDALGTAPLEFQWQKDGQNINGATSKSLIKSNNQLSDAGDYRVIVSNASGKDTSNVAKLQVLVNSRPHAKITSPADSTFYVAGSYVTVTGQGSDFEDGELSEIAMTWNVNFHHDTHSHDQPPVSGLDTIKFEIPNSGEVSDNVWYKIILTVKDSQNFVGRDTITLIPKKSTISINTIPEGRSVLVDGQPTLTPVSIKSVVGILRSIGIPLPIEDGLIFSSWSNHGDTVQTFATPANDTTFTANFAIITEAEESEVSDGFSIYPNPSKGKATLLLTAPVENEIKITVYDVFSRAVYFKTYNLESGKNYLSLDLEGFSDGIYNVNISGKNFSRSKKVYLSQMH